MAEFKPNYEPKSDPNYGSPNIDPVVDLPHYRSPNGSIPSVSGTGYGSPNGVGVDYTSPNSDIAGLGLGLDPGPATNWSLTSIWEETEGVSQLTENLEPMTVGVRFKTTEPGRIAGIKFRSAVSYSREYTVTLWSNIGAKLGTVTFIVSGLGWQSAYFAIPVAIAVDTLYVASLFMRSGFHLRTPNGYATAHVNGVIQGIADNDGGSNGILSLNATETFPTIAGGASNYWVDVGFIAN